MTTISKVWLEINSIVCDLLFDVQCGGIGPCLCYVNSPYILNRPCLVPSYCFYIASMMAEAGWCFVLAVWEAKQLVSML